MHRSLVADAASLLVALGPAMAAPAHRVVPQSPLGGDFSAGQEVDNAGIAAGTATPDR